MEKITTKSFPLGWLPSDDEDNGRVEGLARLDNLRIDDKGILRNILGENSIGQAFSANINRVFSKKFGSSVHQYASSGGAVKKNTGSGNLTTNVIPNGGNNSWSAFGSGFGAAFISSGTKNKVDDGSTIRDWGVNAPSSAPGVSVNTSDRFVVAENNFTDMGWIVALAESSTLTGLPEGYIEMETDSDLFAAIAQYPPDTVNITLNTNNFASGWEGSDFDIFSLDIRIEDPAKVSFVRVEFLLKTPIASDGLVSGIEDFFYYEWIGGDPENNPNDISPAFKSGINQWNVLTARRADFRRVGGNTSVGWSNVKGVRVIYICTESQTCAITKLIFTGGPLNSEAIRYSQVNVKVNDEYQSPSGLGPHSDWYVAQNTTIEITPDYTGIGTDFDKVWIFRQGGDLDHWYRVAELTSGTFIDTITDVDALIENVKASMHITVAPDNIVGIEGPFFERMLVLTNSSLWISEKLQPESFSTQNELQIASDSDEICLFVVKVSNSSILVGTTNDIYELTGPFTIDTITGLMNTEIRTLGIKFPPVSWAYAVDKGTLYYEASDGWRALQGSQSWNISGDLILLYNNESRHDVKAVRHTKGEVIRNSCIIAYEKLWCLVDRSDYTRNIHLYDFKTKTWSLRYTAVSNYTPSALFIEENGAILAGDGTGQVKNIDVGGTDIVSSVFLRTFYMDNGSPNTRKDGHTLKVRATSGAQVTIVLRGKYTDGTQTGVFTEETIFGSQEEKQFDISTIGLCKSYQLEISCTTNGAFVFYGFEIDYLPRPEQLTNLRIQPSNLGTFSRKKFLGLPIVIDTLGEDVTFIPTIDGVDQAPFGTLNTSEKRTVMHWFKVSTIGVDIGGRISSEDGVFEFYEIDPSQAIYEKLPVPSYFYELSPTNMGTPSRKRFNNIPFVADPLGGIITFIPIFDGVAQTPQQFSGNGRQTFKYYVTTDVTPIDIGGSFSGTKEFEFSGLEKPLILEVLPEPTKFLRIPPENFGTYARKRFNRLSFIIDTRGENVTVTPVLDGISQSGQVFNTSTKEVKPYFFSDDVVARNISLNINGTSDFEFYGLLKIERMEILPEPTTFLRIPHEYFGTYARKRFNRLAVIIDTRGYNVTFTPILDGISQSTSILNTSRKSVVPHFFPSSKICRSLGYTLDGANEFEFYELLKPENMEILPEPVKNLVIPASNLGYPEKKRIRTIPFTINTNGGTVTITPKIDGIALSSQNFSNSEKKSETFFIVTDVFGTDVELTLNSNTEFEWYGLDKLEEVELLPIGKKFDQIGPIFLSKIGKVRSIQLILMATGTALNYVIYNNDIEITNGSLVTVVNKMKPYTISMPKGINSNVFRVELSSDDEFHKISATARLDLTGNDTAYKEVKL